LSGQQGYMNREAKKWELSEQKKDLRFNGPDDDTETLPMPFQGKRNGGDYWAPRGAPSGPRVDRASFKRPRTDDKEMEENPDDLPYEG
jgi:hypothetical protein